VRLTADVRKAPGDALEEVLEKDGDVVRPRGWRLELTSSRPTGGFILGLTEPKLPLRVRPWRPGDRVRARNGTRKLQDVFTDAKILREDRPHQPVIYDSAGEILWVVGVWPEESTDAGCSLFLGAESMGL
jgi:tRNA(Ile)-lysidine synthase